LDALSDADGLTELDGLWLTDTEADGLRLTLADADGLTLAE
jgi:hypothetical protein